MSQTLVGYGEKMPLDWINTKDLSFNNLLLLERVQIGWLPGWLPEVEMALALRANPVVAWYLRHKCPEVGPWLDRLEEMNPGDAGDADAVCAAEQRVLHSMNDLLVYIIDPSLYDAQPFLGWDSSELTSLVDFRDKVVLDIGSGTGRLAFVVAPDAGLVFCIEPVGNLRRYLKAKARRLGLNNVFVVDGLVTEIPFPDGYADVVMGGHVFGDQPEAERLEMERVAKDGGMVILCPGNSDQDNRIHQELLGQGYQWSRFEEPVDSWVRKYWKIV